MKEQMQSLSTDSQVMAHPLPRVSPAHLDWQDASAGHVDVISQWRQNLQTLEDLQQRSRFMLTELETLIK